MSTTSVNTGAATEEGKTSAPEGHDEAMAQKFEQAQESVNSPDTSTAESGQEGGEKILGKFDSQEDLIEAYRNLEAKLSKSGSADAQGQANEGQGDSTGGQENGEQERAQAAQEAVEKAEGVDMDSLSREYFENGDLTDSSYEALEKAGIPRKAVQEFIEGQEARAAQYQEKALEAIGGEEEFSKISEWAANNLPPEQIDQYNNAVDSNDPARMQEAIKALAYEYSRARPSEPSLLGGGNNSTTTNRFESVAQLTEAMADPKYQTDPAYRKEVEQKLANSNIM